MADTTKRIAAVVVAISALVLGFDKIGGIEVAPGPDLGFSCAATPGVAAHALSLSADHGDIRCFLRLRLRRIGAVPKRMGARLSDGTPLQVWLQPNAADGTLTLSVYKAGFAREKFLWPSGVDVRILDWDRALAGSAVEDWSIFLSDNQHDSRSKARWRAIWLWLCRGLALVAIAGVVVTAFKQETPHQSFTPEICVANLIDSIDSGSAAETDQLRALLKKVVLEGAPAAEARDSLAGSAVERMQLWFKARKLFLGHLDHLVEKLTAYRADLTS